MSERIYGECELGPIRPPSEASSLLLRVSRNCPWNKCAFCPVYKTSKFSKRSEEDVISDIDLLAEAAARVKSRSGGTKDSWGIDAKACLNILHDPQTTETEKRVAVWLHRGGEHVFLQDADSLAIPSHRVVKILRHLYQRFPRVTRVTTYARSRTLVARSPSQLRSLREAGLTRIHVGVESGSKEVLGLVKKGCRPEHHIDGCGRAIEAGFELCCYVMPGLGGRRFTREHAQGTREVLRAIDPHHIRLRTVFVPPGTPLEQMLQEGEFELLEENDIVREIHLVLKGLVGCRGRVVSDHDLNLLMNIEGHLTDDAEELDRICRDYLNLAPDTQDGFAVARRMGYYGSLDRYLSDSVAVERFANLARQIRDSAGGSLIKGMTLQIGRRSI